MKVAYLINQYPTPSHTFIRREIHALEAMGWTVVRYAARPLPAPPVDPVGRAETDRTRTVLGAGAATILGSTLLAAITRPGRFLAGLGLARRMAKPSGRGLFVHLNYLAQACTLLRWTRADGVKHVHAHFGTNPASVAMLLNAIGGPTYSVTVHGPEEFDSPVALSLGEKVERSAFVAGISSFGRSQLCRWSAFDQWDKVKIVRCAVDASFLSEPPAPLPAEKKFLHLGRISPQKGQAVMVKAAARLKREGHKFTIDVIGEDELKGALAQLIVDNDVVDCVKLLGVLPNTEVKSRLDTCRVLVMPSFAEGLPVIIMESLARHRPVISTTIAGIPELVIDGENGWLVPAGDEESLANAMRAALLASDTQLMKMGAAGAARVKLNHDADTEAAKLSAMFKTLVDKNE